MIDEAGYRYGVGIILINDVGQVLLAKRIGYKDAWQFPQGGIDGNETPEQAMYRELEEELGLTKDSVCLLQVTDDWLAYDLPENYRRYYRTPLCVGQKQKWFLLHLQEEDHVIALDQTLKPEFDQWCWADYGQPMKYVVFFKADVYRSVLKIFEPEVKKIIKNH